MNGFAAIAFLLLVGGESAAAQVAIVPKAQAAPASRAVARLANSGSATVIWARQPSNYDLYEAFPVRALRTNKEGRAVLSCMIGARGEMAHCTVVEENPKGYGFGTAAMSLVDKFAVSTRSAEGAPMEGATLSIPIIFNQPATH